MAPLTWGTLGGSTSLGVFKQLLKSVLFRDSDIQEVFEFSKPVTDIVDKVPCTYITITTKHGTLRYIFKLKPTYLYTYIHTHTYIHTYIHTYTHIHTYIHTYIHACMYVYMYTT